MHVHGTNGCGHPIPPPVLPYPTRCALPAEDIRPSTRSRTSPRGRQPGLFGSLPVPPLSAAGGHATLRSPPPPAPGPCRPPAAPTSTPTPPSHAPHRSRTSAAVEGGRPKRASSENGSFVSRKKKEKQSPKFLNRFLHPQDSGPAASHPSAPTDALRWLLRAPAPPRSHFVQLGDPVSMAGEPCGWDGARPYFYV